MKKYDTSVNILGLTFDNPILPASGPIVEGLENLISLNELPLGGLVTKTISVRGAEVVKPCIVGTKNMIYNCELWSESDFSTWLEILHEFSAVKKKPLGISVGYNCADFETIVPRLSQYADFFEVSTHYNKGSLSDLVKCMTSLTDKPVLMKTSPQSEGELQFVETAVNSGASGIVAFNSFGPGVVVDLKSRSVLIGNSEGNVWVSGPAIKPFVLKRIATIRRHFPELPIIGCGGVSSAVDALEMILAGADLVQMLSGALIKGRGHYADVVAQLPKVMAENHIGTIASLRKTSLSINASGEGDYPKIEPKLCTTCGTCVRVCPMMAYGPTDAKAIKQKGIPEFDRTRCITCGLCESMCPAKAITGVLRSAR